jgi:hypothetical protein
MTLRRLATLQWVGLFAGWAIWVCAHVLGWGITVAECGPSGSHFGIQNTVWEATTLSTAALLIAFAEAAALAVVFGTRDVSFSDGPPQGRIRFLAIAAAVANVLFFTMCVLDLVGTVSHVACRQS